MQYSISFLLLKVENRLIHYSYEKVEPFIISIPSSYGSHFPIMSMFRCSLARLFRFQAFLFFQAFKTLLFSNSIVLYDQ